VESVDRKWEMAKGRALFLEDDTQIRRTPEPVVTAVAEGPRRVETDRAEAVEQRVDRRVRSQSGQVVSDTLVDADAER